MTVVEAFESVELEASGGAPWGISGVKRPHEEIGVGV